MFGYRFDKPVQHTREYLSILRPLLHGEPASFTGQQLSAHVTLSTPAPGPGAAAAGRAGPGHAPGGG